MTENVSPFWRYVYGDQVTVPPGHMSNTDIVIGYVTNNCPYNAEYVQVSRDQHGTGYRVPAKNVTLSRRGKGYSFLCEGVAEFNSYIDEVRTMIGLVPYVIVANPRGYDGDMTIEEALRKIESRTADAFVPSSRYRVFGYSFPSLPEPYLEDLRKRTAKLLRARL